MSNQELATVCKELRLSNMANIARQDQFQDDSKSDWLLSLLKQEIKIRNDKKIARLYKQAKFPKRKTLYEYVWHDQINFSTPNSRQQLLDLKFIEKNENAVFVGTPGTGKTHLATALGVKAIENGINVKFWRVAELVDQLEQEWHSLSIERFKKKCHKYQLIILDEMGYVPFSKTGSELLFQLISDWYETKSIIITSNLEFSQWSKVFIDPRLTAALVDRLIHHAHIVSFTGESYRLKNSLSNN
jgi:DNA replication protein DnaC